MVEADDELKRGTLESKSTLELLRSFAESIELLRERKIVRTSNSPTGDYAECLFQEAFGWRLEPNAALGYDATDSEGYKYQIKCRRMTRHNNSRQLGVIRNFERADFHYLAVVIFKEDFSVYRAAIVSREQLIKVRQRFSRHVNGMIFNFSDDVWDKPGVKDVSKELAAAETRL